MHRPFVLALLAGAALFAPLTVRAEEATPLPSDAPVPTLYESTPSCPPAEIGPDGVASAPKDAPADCVYALGDGVAPDTTLIAPRSDELLPCSDDLTKAHEQGQPMVVAIACLLPDGSILPLNVMTLGGPTDAGPAVDSCIPDENGVVDEMCQIRPISAEVSMVDGDGDRGLVPGFLLLALAAGVVGYAIGSARGRRETAGSGAPVVENASDVTSDLGIENNSDAVTKSVAAKKPEQQ